MTEQLHLSDLERALKRRADEGDVEAQFELGCLLADPEYTFGGRAQQLKTLEGSRYIQLAAAAGHRRAQFQLEHGQHAIANAKRRLTHLQSGVPKQLRASAGITIAVAVGCLLWTNSRSARLDTLQESLISKQREARQLDKIIGEVQHFAGRKRALEMQLRFIEQVRRERAASVPTLGALARAVPPQVFLTEIVEEDHHLTIRGHAPDHAHVSLFARALANSPHFVNVVLEASSRSSERDGAAYSFKFSCTIPQPDGTSPSTFLSKNRDEHGGLPRRDPFRSTIEASREQSGDQPPLEDLGDLQKYEIDELRLVDVVAGRAVPYGTIMTPDGRPHTVTRGTLVGKDSGRIRTLTSSCAIIVEEFRDYLGRNVFNTIRKCVMEDNAIENRRAE